MVGSRTWGKLSPSGQNLSLTVEGQRGASSINGLLFRAAGFPTEMHMDFCNHS